MYAVINFRQEWDSPAIYPPLIKEIAMKVCVPLVSHTYMIQSISYMTYMWSEAPYVFAGGTDTLCRILEKSAGVEREDTPDSFRIASLFDNDGNPTDDLCIWFEWREDDTK